MDWSSMQWIFLIISDCGTLFGMKMAGCLAFFVCKADITLPTIKLIFDSPPETLLWHANRFTCGFSRRGSSTHFILLEFFCLTLGLILETSQISKVSPWH